MSDLVDRMPTEIAPVDQSDPEYEFLMAVSRAGKRNLDYYLGHEEEINERFPGPCAILIFNGKEVKSCANLDEIMELLDTLDEVERSAALQFEQPEAGTVWAL